MALSNPGTVVAMKECTCMQLALVSLPIISINFTKSSKFISPVFNPIWQFGEISSLTQNKNGYSKKCLKGRQKLGTRKNYKNLKKCLKARQKLGT